MIDDFPLVLQHQVRTILTIQRRRRFLRASSLIVAGLARDGTETGPDREKSRRLSSRHKDRSQRHFSIIQKIQKFVSGHQAHIYETCLSAERGLDMDTGKEVLFALPLKVSKWLPLRPACPKLTFCFHNGQPCQTCAVLRHTENVCETTKVQEQDWRRALEQKSRAPPARPSDGTTAQCHSRCQAARVSVISKSGRSGQSQTHAAMTQ